MLACLADCQRMLGHYEAARLTTRAALGYELPPGRRAYLLLSTAWQALADGDWPAVRAAIAASLDQLEAGGGDAAYRIAAGYHSPFIAGPGGLPLAERFARLLAAHPDGQQGPLLAARLAVSAWCGLLSGRLDEAAGLAEGSVAAARRVGTLSWIEGGVGCLPWYRAGLGGDLAAAHAGLDAFLALVRDEPSAISLRAWEPLYRFMEAKAIWLHGDPVAMRAAVLAAEVTARPDEWPIGQTVRARLRALVAIAEGDHAAAESLLLAACDEQERHPEARLASDARLLLAHLYMVWGRPDEALAALVPALDACAADDTPDFLLPHGAPVAAPLPPLPLPHVPHIPTSPAPRPLRRQPRRDVLQLGAQPLRFLCQPVVTEYLIGGDGGAAVASGCDRITGVGMGKGQQDLLFALQPALLQRVGQCQRPLGRGNGLGQAIQLSHGRADPPKQLRLRLLILQLFGQRQSRCELVERVLPLLHQKMGAA